MVPLRSVQRQVEPHPGSPARLGLHIHAAAQLAHAFADAEQAKGLGAQIGLFGVETATPVGHRQFEAVRSPGEGHGRAVAAGVDNHVAQQLLGRAEHHDLLLVTQIAGRAVHPEGHLQALRRFHPLGQPVQGLFQPQLEEHRRADGAGQVARVGDGLVQQPQHLADFGVGAGKDGVAAEGFQADLHHRQGLAHVVVQVLGDGAALAGLGQAQLQGQFAQTAACLGVGRGFPRQGLPEIRFPPLLSLFRHE